MTETGTGPFAFGNHATFHVSLWGLLNLGKLSGPQVASSLVSVLHAERTFDLVWTGAIVLGAGAVLALVLPAAGFVMIAGAALAPGGTLTTSATAHQVFGSLTATFAPDAGVVLGLAGGILATAVWVLSWAKRRGASKAPAS